MPSAKACSHGTYGVYCNNTCDCHCTNNVTCNAITGDCPSECVKGYPTVLIVSVTGALLFAAVTTLIGSLAMKRLKNRKMSEQQTIWPEHSNEQGIERAYTNRILEHTGDEEAENASYRIHVSDLEDYVVQGRKKGTFISEFEFIVRNSTTYHACSVGGRKENERKNRYSNILPYDHTRVVLEKLPNDPYSDYINASYINGYKNPKKYIATQGPKPLRMADFWRMVWQEGSCKIVMVTNLIEGGETKCKKYWPKKTDHYGSLKIQMVDSDVFVDFTIRTFILSQNGEKRDVKHFHFTTWPEKKTPLYTKSLLRFIGNVRDYEPLGQSPVIVHSSVGCGRAGAFILLDYMLDMVQWEHRVNLVECVLEMREQRMNMVETAEQYAFIYETLLDAMWPIETSVRCNKFTAHMKELSRIDPETGRKRIEKEFERINKLYSPSENNQMQQQPCKIETAYLNPNEEPLSPVLLCTFKEGNCSDPLTLVEVDGYRRRKASLITTLPTSKQLNEFWNNVYRTGCQTIVLLNDLKSMIDSGFSRYWTREGATVRFGDFAVEYANKESEEDIMIRNFRITDNNEIKGKPVVRRLRHFHLTNWNAAEKAPPTPMALVKLIAKVEKWLQETPKHPVIVQCLDGKRSSGLFCTCSFISSQIALEQEVDVYQAVKTIRAFCPPAIDDLEQYSYCYTFAACYLDKFRNYANFS